MHSDLGGWGFIFGRKFLKKSTSESFPSGSVQKTDLAFEFRIVLHLMKALKLSVYFASIKMV